MRIVDSTNFPISTAIAAALVEVEPGGLRELHWHPNADEWQYYLEGNGRMTVFASGGKARTFDYPPSSAILTLSRLFPISRSIYVIDI